MSDVESRMSRPDSQPLEERQKLVAALRANYAIERRNAETYAYLATLEREPQRRAVLQRLSDAESQHAERWAAKLKEFGADLPPTPADGFCGRWRKWLMRGLGIATALRRMEAEEEKVAKVHLEDVKRHGTEDVLKVADEILAEEQSHGRLLTAMYEAPAPVPTDPNSRLRAIIGRERHRAAGGWLGSAIYGVNDGLGAVFGIVSGMAGYGASSQIVLASGLAGTIASALSMGSGAWLAAKSQREAFEAEVTRERRELEEHPAEEREELELMYQLKGFSEVEAKMLAERIASNPEHLLQTKLHEELGLSGESFPRPWTSAVSAGLSTAVGAFIPLIPSNAPIPMTSQNIRAVIFDMDGVVVDSLQLHLDSWKQVLKEMRGKRESLDVRRHFGHATRVLLRELLAERDDGRKPARDEIEFWYRRKLAVTLELVPRAARPVPGFVEFVQRVRARGLPTVLASAATAPFVEAVLDKIGVREQFDAILTLDDVTQPKPHPEIFIKAARLLNIPIKDCLVIEDSHPGIEAALASGAVCCALLTMLTAEEVPRAHVVARDYHELWRWLDADLTRTD